MFACLLNFLSARLSILLIMVVKSLKSYLYYFFLKLYSFLIFVPVLYILLFSCIAWYAFSWCANLYYVAPCHLPDIISCHVNTWHPTCYYLALAPYYNMTYYPPPVILIFDLWLSHLREYYTWYPLLYIQWPESAVLMYSWIPDHVLHLLFP